jgi:hypothetical protein
VVYLQVVLFPLGAARSGTYSALTEGGTSVGIVAVANGGLGFTSGFTIFNTASSAISGTIQYYSLDGTAQANPQSFIANSHASYSVYQGAAGLPPNFYGTAVINIINGPPNSLIVSTNMESANFFYTFSEPS